MAMPTAAAPRRAAHVHNSTERRQRTPGLWLLCLALAGCASGSKLKTLPSDGPTMAEVYRQHQTGQRSAPANGAVHQPHGDDARLQAGHFQRSASNQIDSRFARLPNPDLVMYVTPHLSPNGRYPVPGYSTVFPMYETVEYALPGELPSRAAATPTTEPR